jgi:lipopolysaccharide export LptBFGC system permease protein LptF
MYLRRSIKCWRIKSRFRYCTTIILRFILRILFPIFLFLSVIWFTSKLANDTEIIAILSSGISFTRFLRPYIIGASIVSVLYC